MNLDDAIVAFEGQRKGNFSKDDRARIVSTAQELKLDRFELYVVPSKKYPLFVRDLDDVLHIHSTMMVASQPFSGSTDRGADPYPKYPHHLALTEWVFEKGKSGHPVCPACHIEIPLVGKCEYCDWSPSEPD